MPKMKLYSRDDIMKKTMFPGMPGGDDEDEDEDEEEGQGMPGQGMPGGAPEVPEDKELRAIAEAMRSVEASKAKVGSQGPCAFWDQVLTLPIPCVSRALFLRQCSR